ncbi:DUF3168 domain-containing protein [Cohnella luojiensis]|nr:DUF3168 domain-containing protein [Cohnella luojiensis]
MNFEAALTIELESIPALNNRVYPLAAPEEKFNLTQPYLIFVSSAGLRTRDLDSYQSGKTVKGELNVIAPRFGDVVTTMTSVIDKLVSMEQRAIGGTGPFIQEIVYRQPVEMYEDKPKLYRSLVEFEVYF